KPRFDLGTDGKLVLIPTPLARLGDYERFLEEPRRALELGRHDDWYEAAVYQDPLYDYLGTVRLFTEAFVLARRRYFWDDRLLTNGAFNPGSRAFRIQMEIFRLFADSVRSRGAQPLVVLFPDRESIHAARLGRPTILGPMGAALREQHLEFADLTEAFVA